VKLISWNVNGIRSVLTKGFIEFVKTEDPDILCLQEIKAHPHQVDKILEEYSHAWNSAKKPGYSGTAVFSKVKPLSIKYGLNNIEDSEGRVITLEFKKYYLVNVYTPNAQHELTRLKYRMQWDQDFLMHLKDLEKTKPIIFGGDLNVAHKEIDLKNPKSNERNPGFTIEERTNFDKILNSGFIDTFREFNPSPDQYTWWSYRFNARKRNIGWRIDYFCISKELRPHLENAFILKETLGSDHAPIGIVLKE